MKPRFIAIATLFLTVPCFGDILPLVNDVEFQPIAAQVSRIMQTLDLLGEPLPAADAAQLRDLIANAP